MVSSFWLALHAGCLRLGFFSWRALHATLRSGSFFERALHAGSLTLMPDNWALMVVNGFWLALLAMVVNVFFVSYGANAR